jgi:hypothetical protein
MHGGVESVMSVDLKSFEMLARDLQWYVPPLDFLLDTTIEGLGYRYWDYA